MYVVMCQWFVGVTVAVQMTQWIHQQCGTPSCTSRSDGDDLRQGSETELLPTVGGTVQTGLAHGLLL